MVSHQDSCHPSVPSICGYTLTSVGAARPLWYPWIHQHMAVGLKGQKMHISWLCWCLCLYILRFVILDASPAPDSTFLWWLWFPKQENNLTFSAAFASQRATFHRAACWIERELACSQKHCHIPTSFSLKVLFIKKAHTWGRRSIFAALLSQAPADPSVPASRMFATLHLLQLLLASPNPDSQELPSAVTCYFLFFVENKPWEHNGFYNDVTTFKKKNCLQRGLFHFLHKNILLLTENDKENKSYAFDSCSKRPSPQEQGKPNLHCIICLEGEIHSPPWGSGMNLIPSSSWGWFCSLCCCSLEVSVWNLWLSTGKGSWGTGLLPWAWPSSTAAQPLILLNPCSLWL